MRLTSYLRPSILTSLGMLLVVSPTSATAKNCIRHPKDCAKDVGRTATTVVTAPIDVVTGKPVGTTAVKTEKELERGAHRVSAETKRTGENVEDAGKAIARYVEAQAEGLGDLARQTERRVRRGQLSDAIWHAAVDPIKTAERSAAEAARQSTILQSAGAIAATAYGGPGGAAAYTAWLTYRETGDADAAFKAGLLAGATSAGVSAVGNIPGDSAGEIAKKTILAGSIGGTAVAAAGGDEEAVVEGFVKSGGMILIQEGYRQAIGQQMDTRASVGEPYCMATVAADCSPNTEAYVRDANGKIQTDAAGKPMVDIRKTDLRRPHVGTWAKDGKTSLGSEQSPLMIGISKWPAMNAMAVGHDHLVVTWDLNTFQSVATIAPAIVVTYYGTQAPTLDKIEKTVVNEEKGAQSTEPTKIPD